MSSVVSRRHCHQKCSSFQKLAHTGLHAFRTVGGRLRIKPKQSPDNSSSITTPGGCATFTVSNSGIHAGAFGTRWSAIASICAGPCGRLRTPCSYQEFLIIVANRFAAPAAGDMPLRAIPSKAALSSAHFRPAPVAPPTAFRSELVYTVRRKGKCRNGQVTARQITFPELKRRCTMSTTCWIAVGVVGTLILLCIIGRCCCCKKDKGCRN